MKIGQILNSQITASSSRNDSYAPKRGRLKNVPFIKRGEWLPLADVIQLVIFTVTYLMSIIIQFKFHSCSQMVTVREHYVPFAISNILYRK